MEPRTLNSRARLVLALNFLYSFAEALCSVFVGVYFWIHSEDFTQVCLHYLILYGVTGIVFLPAGWYAEARDRVHLFQLGLALHALYYGAILWLGKESAVYAPHLGALLGVTWGLFWAGNHTLTFDAVKVGERDYFFGWFLAITQGPRLVAPLIAAGIIALAPTSDFGFQLVFALAALLYGVAMAWAFRFPPDKTREPYRIWRALFPPKEHRDWRNVMMASFSIAGSFHILSFLPGLLLYMETGQELHVGALTSAQAILGILSSWFLGRRLLPHTRAQAMRISIWCHLLGGGLVLWSLNPYTLVAFGFLNSLAMPLFTIPHASVKFDVIDSTIQDSRQRIAYLCAWEFPLAMGRVCMMATMILLVALLDGLGLRVAVFLLCINRLATYWLLTRTEVMRGYHAEDTPAKV